MGKERVMSDGQQHSQATIAKQGFLLSQIEWSNITNTDFGQPFAIERISINSVHILDL
jgi:hypothetical protein